MQGSELDVFKDIPGYKAIMKAVLRNQIQMLVQQLSDQVGEEAVLLTASVSDGSFSHLGSESGKVFVEDHDEIKSQFLGHCLKRYHRKKTEDAKQLLGTSENIFPSPQMDQVPRFPSTPMVQRQSYIIKRPSPYGKPGKGLMQKTAANQRQTLASKQDSLQTSFNTENYNNFKSNTESQSVTIASNEESINSANDIKISGIGSLKDIENIPQGTASLTEVNINDNLIDDENAGLNIKREPGDMLNDPNSVDNTGAGGLTEGMASGQWDTSAGLGEGSFDASGQEYVGGESNEGGFRMIMVDKREKKPRKPLTLEQRVFALKLLSTGLSARKTAAAMGVGRSQIQEIFKHRDEIMADWQSDNVNPDRKRKSRKTGNEEINTMCLKWYHEAVANGYSVSGPVLQQKALELAVQLGIPSFKASNGWLESFRKRHMIVTAGQVSKSASGDKKGKSGKDGMDVDSLEEALFATDKVKNLDDSYIQEHVDRALNALDMSKDEARDRAIGHEFSVIDENECLKEHMNKHGVVEDCEPDNHVGKLSEPYAGQNVSEAYNKVVSSTMSSSDLQDLASVQSNVSENYAYRDSVSKYMAYENILSESTANVNNPNSEKMDPIQTALANLAYATESLLYQTEGAEKTNKEEVVDKMT